jgi:hypothetical protein
MRDIWLEQAGLFGARVKGCLVSKEAFERRERWLLLWGRGGLEGARTSKCRCGGEGGEAAAVRCVFGGNEGRGRPSDLVVRIAVLSMVVTVWCRDGAAGLWVRGAVRLPVLNGMLNERPGM